MKHDRPTAIQTTLGDLASSLTTVVGGVLRDPERVQYRGYVIYYDPKPGSTPNGFIDWTFHHDDYDGPGDDRVGWGVSVADCKAQIDEQIEILIEDEAENPRRAPEASPTGGLRADANYLLGVDSDFWGTGLEGSTPVDDGEPSPHPDLVPDRWKAIDEGHFDEFEPEDE